MEKSAGMRGAVTAERPPTSSRHAAAYAYPQTLSLICCAHAVPARPPACLSALQMEVVSAAADAMFDPVAFIDNPATDTQAWLYWNRGARQLCLAVRGTEQAKWQDILTDLSLIPASLDPEGIAEQAWQRPRQPAQATADQRLEEAMVRCSCLLCCCCLTAAPPRSQPRPVRCTHPRA